MKIAILISALYKYYYCYYYYYYYYYHHNFKHPGALHPSSATPRKTRCLRDEPSKSTVLEEYKDCFDKIGIFPDDKYHVQLIDNPKSVVHPPRSVPVHKLPLHKMV